jgi:hypothetical protein
LGSEIVYDGWVLLVHAGSARSLTDAGQGRFRFCHVTLPGVSAGNPSPGYVAVAMVVIVDRQSRLHPTACIYLDHTRPHRHDQEMTVTVPLLIGAFSIAAYFLLTSPRRSPEVHADADALTSVLIPAYTSHSRSLPKQSKHAFSYPLLYLGVDVDALESGALDLPGRIVRYGGRPITKLLGILNLVRRVSARKSSDYWIPEEYLGRPLDGYGSSPCRAVLGSRASTRSVRGLCTTRTGGSCLSSWRCTIRLERSECMTHRPFYGGYRDFSGV